MGKGLVAYDVTVRGPRKGPANINRHQEYVARTKAKNNISQVKRSETLSSSGFILFLPRTGLLPAIPWALWLVILYCTWSMGSFMRRSALHVAGASPLRSTSPRRPHERSIPIILNRESRRSRSPSVFLFSQCQ